MAKRGLYANIHAKRKRIKAGSGEKMRKPGSKGAPTAANFRRAAKTAKKRKKAQLTRDELQTFMLQNRLSVEELFRMTGHKPHDIRGYLTGKKKIPHYWSQESLQQKL